MSPGILGQLLAMPATARDDHQACLRCHAPLAEQADSLVTTLTQEKRADSPLASHEAGLTCAGCHVRQHQRFGPPARSPTDLSATAPHGGWTATTAFEDARFCAACHQFEIDDPAVNGKLLENTYQEWQESRYAREGKTCQTCHMPDRRHLWRGIHDPDMVRKGITLITKHPPALPEEVSLQLTLRNTGVGHYFPTYVTPRVVIEAWQQDEQGRVLEKTREEKVIAREVTLDLNHEAFDTRLPPDGEVILNYRRPRHDRATALVWRVRVEPDAFYRRFYRSVLEGGTTPKGDALLRQAVQLAEGSPYNLFSGQQRLDSRF